jgi:hypothetical protein
MPRLALAAIKEQYMPRIGDSNQDEMKAAVKQAIKEWLDSQFALFGRWSFYALCSIGLAALVHFALKMDGWHK